MPIFIALGKATDAGMTNLDHLTGRHEVARRRARDLGGRVIGSYATLGQYDFVVILDCPDLETCMRILNRETGGGNIRYETMPALPTREFAQLFLDEAQLEEERRVLRIGRSARQRAAQAAAHKRSRKAPTKSLAKASATRAAAKGPKRTEKKRAAERTARKR